MHRSLHVSLYVVLMGILLAACARPGGLAATETPEPVRLSLEDSGRTLSLPAGTEIDVTLQTIGPGQYGEPYISSGAIVILDVSLVTPNNPAGPTQLYRFEAVSPGKAVITIERTGYNPGIGPAQNNFKFELTVEVH